LKSKRKKTWWKGEKQWPKSKGTKRKAKGDDGKRRKDLRIHLFYGQQRGNTSFT
jgi:hypothetical protein